MTASTQQQRLDALRMQANQVLGQSLHVPGHVCLLEIDAEGQLLWVDVLFDDGIRRGAWLAAAMASPSSVAEAALRVFIMTRSPATESMWGAGSEYHAGTYEFDESSGIRPMGADGEEEDAAEYRVAPDGRRWS